MAADILLITASVASYICELYLAWCSLNWRLGIWWVHSKLTCDMIREMCDFNVYDWFVYCFIIKLDLDDLSSIFILHLITIAMIYCQIKENSWFSWYWLSSLTKLQQGKKCGGVIENKNVFRKSLWKEIPTSSILKAFTFDNG